MVGTLTTDALTYAGLFLIPAVVGGIILGERLMLIYGPGFGVGQQILPILIASILVYTYCRQLLNTLNAIDRPDLAFRANALFVGANVVLNVVLVWQYGWIGAAVATGLSAGVGLAFAFRYARRLVDFEIPVGEMARQWAAGLLMGLVVYATRALTEGHPIADINEVYVVALVGLGAVVYFLALFAISRTFRTTISDNLPFEVPFVRA